MEDPERDKTYDDDHWSDRRTFHTFSKFFQKIKIYKFIFTKTN